jgi:hypothetical protein
LRAGNCLEARPRNPCYPLWTTGYARRSDHAHARSIMTGISVDIQWVDVVTRYFLCSMEMATLTPAQWLLVIRRHWAIESAPQAHRRKESDDDLINCAQAA